MTSKQQQPEQKSEQSPESPGKFPFPTSGDPEKGKAEIAKPTPQPSSEEALDSGVEESFPASDPVSVTVTKVKLPSSDEKEDAEKKKAGRNAGSKG
ncbi:hypothetical protein FHT32_001920 [Variovorax sp. SG517]|uniref:hypothetical protein n=1 Tax=Variovorax sp. SG517 TaxID=2587117 RepID=UPI00159E160F|nr:hypothetical protein [Variovorax sp. SG517]NVM88272.1 hypothetical protein [Variovorax sp. SG517]